MFVFTRLDGLLNGAGGLILKNRPAGPPLQLYGQKKKKKKGREEEEEERRKEKRRRTGGNIRLQFQKYHVIGQFLGRSCQSD